VKKNFQKKREKPTEGREKGPKKSDSGIRKTKISVKSLFFPPNIYISKEFIPTDKKIPLLLGEIPLFLCLLSESPL
jgi:hypothetical protein